MDIDKINNFFEHIGKKSLELKEAMEYKKEIESYAISESSKQLKNSIKAISRYQEEVYNEELRRHQEIVDNLSNQLTETQKQSLIHLESYREVTKINENLQKQIEFLKTESKENAKEAKISKILAIISIVISIIAIFFW